jgi:hypothetical protein
MSAYLVPNQEPIDKEAWELWRSLAATPGLGVIKAFGFRTGNYSNRSLKAANRDRLQGTSAIGDRVVIQRKDGQFR